LLLADPIRTRGFSRPVCQGNYELGKRVGFNRKHFLNDSDAKGAIYSKVKRLQELALASAMP
jgi:hypothetical protein